MSSKTPLFRVIGPIAAIALVAVTLSCPPAAADDPQSYLYQESTGKAVKTFSWTHRSSPPQEIITVEEQGATFINLCDRSGPTLSWKMTKGSHTAIEAIRRNDQLQISGTLAGKPIQTTETIDDRPWYQPLSYALRSFVESAETQISFWTIRADSLEVVAMQAKKGRVEEVSVAGEKVMAQRVEISREGFLAAFWQGSFWFRETDRVFVRYQAVHGPPGTDETIVQLLDETAKK